MGSTSHRACAECHSQIEASIREADIQSELCGGEPEDQCILDLWDGGWASLA